MTYSPPPNEDKVLTDQGFPRISWALFFENMYEGDGGTEFTPTFQNLGSTGTPTLTGRYYRLGGLNLIFFRVTITPDTNTSSTAGTTYIDNFPVSFVNDGVCFSVSGNLGGSLGHIVAINNRIYTPAWTNVTTPVTIIGIGEAR